MQKPLRIEITPSRMMLGYLLAGHFLCLSVLCSLLLVLGPFYTGAAIFLLMVSFAYHWKNNYRLAGAHSTRELFLKHENCVLIYADGREVKTDLASRHYVSSWLVVIELKHRVLGFSKRLVLFADAVPAEQLRRLRVRLRFPVTNPACNYRESG